VDCGKNFRQNKAENRRNTLCISRFDNAVMAEIFHKTPKMQGCVVGLKTILQKYKEAVKAVDGREKRRYDSYNEET
jgi:hypothetical protein